MKYLTGLILSIACTLSAQNAIRLMPHVPPPRTIFDTWAYFANTTAETQAYDILGFLADGTVLPKQSGKLEPGQVLRIKTTGLFENPAPSHFFVRGEISATLEFTSPFSASLQLFLPEQESIGDQFRLYCQQWNDQFVGLAVVNLGDEPAQIRLRQADFAGNELADAVLPAPVPVLGKGIFTLAQVMPGLASSGDACSLDLESSQPVIIQIFRGDVPIRAGAVMEVLMPNNLRSRQAVTDPWQDVP